jgi:SARP family transcriptional regulator, regulator of embCAB operon
MDVDIKVLGRLQATVVGVSFVPTASRERQVLAILALNVGHVVKASMIMDEIWGERLPSSVVTTLHTYISRLRRRLESALAGDERFSPKGILVTEHTGYRLNIDDEDIDVARYERLSSAGRQSIDEGDFAKASATLRFALAVWRGSALADVTVGSRLKIETVRLEENRLTDLDLRIEADLHLGRHRQLLGELAALTAQYPLLENFQAKYMLALYHSGRQSHALDRYQQLRAIMIDQLGIEPSALLRQLHGAMLRGDQAVDDQNLFLNQRMAAAF